MKLTCSQEDLSRGLSIVSRVVSGSPSLPILSHLLLKTEEEFLKLAATDLETTISFWLSAKVEKEGAITIPAKVLTEFVSSLPFGDLSLLAEGTKLKVETPEHKSVYLGSSPDEFPTFPSVKEKSFLDVDYYDLKEALEKTVFAAATEESRPVLTGVLWKLEKKEISFVATDGFRLSLKKMEVDLKKRDLESLIIPARTLQEIKRILGEVKGDKEEKFKVSVFLTEDKNQIVFKGKDFEISSRLLEGEFPRFEEIVPETFETQLVVLKEEFTKATRIASIFVRDGSAICLSLMPEENLLKISSKSAQIGENESSLEAQIKGKPIKFFLNARYLLDALACIQTEEIVLELLSPDKPAIFKLKDKEEFLHLISPVRAQE